MEHREPGYYWVQLGADPAIIAEWTNSGKWLSLEWSLTRTESERVIVLGERLTPPQTATKF